MTAHTTDVIVAISAAVFAAAAAILIWTNTKAMKKATGAQLILNVDRALFEYDEIHHKLRAGGVWSSGTAGPETPQDWVQVERYMGLFERMNRMIDNGLLSVRDVSDFYGYRLDNIISNPTIRRAKLEGSERQRWCEFIVLQQRLATYQRTHSRREC